MYNKFLQEIILKRFNTTRVYVPHIYTANITIITEERIMASVSVEKWWKAKINISF
ncbi:MAG: hypothetical protein ABJB05_11205 [Parafilimonas sp.]